MSARKSSHRTIFLIVSSGSPLALVASSLRSTSKKPVCPMTRSLHPPMAHCRQRVRFAATWREEFFEVPLYQFLAAEIRALHCSYGVGDGESYKRALTFLENCERYTLRSLVRRSAKHHAEVTVDHAKRVFSRALKKLDTSQGHNPTLRAMIVHLLK